ncbi:MAG: acyl carrier protein [Bacteroidales bacterium]|nr:acyl carrier protein [Bacteroidales bacterium]
MTNLEKLNGVFCEVFLVDAAALGTDFDSQHVDGWDSVRQLSLASNLEDTFDIMLDPVDILELTSYENAKSMLAKYEIAL